MHSYKAGNLVAKDMSDDDALVYAEVHNIGVILEPTADGQLTAESALIDAPGDDDDVPAAEPVKSTPKAKAPRKSRGGKGTPAQPEVVAPTAIVPPAAPKVAEPEKAASPDKKRKRSGKKVADEPVASIEKEAETPKASAKPRKKKAKGDA